MVLPSDLGLSRVLLDGSLVSKFKSFSQKKQNEFVMQIRKKAISGRSSFSLESEESEQLSLEIGTLTWAHGKGCPCRHGLP
jgi:hypothetical protein